MAVMGPGRQGFTVMGLGWADRGQPCISVGHEGDQFKV